MNQDNRDSRLLKMQEYSDRLEELDQQKKRKGKIIQILFDFKSFLIAGNIEKLQGQIEANEMIVRMETPRTTQNRKRYIKK